MQTSLDYTQLKCRRFVVSESANVCVVILGLKGCMVGRGSHRLFVHFVVLIKHNQTVNCAHYQPYKAHRIIFDM